MDRNDLSVRALAIAIAAVIVGGAVLALGSTSNANFREAVAAVEQRYAGQPLPVVGEPLRVDVVVARSSTRTVARNDERAEPRT
jgi:hypothetical protein